MPFIVPLRASGSRCHILVAASRPAGASRSLTWSGSIASCRISSRSPAWLHAGLCCPSITYSLSPSLGSRRYGSAVQQPTVLAPAPDESEDSSPDASQDPSPHHRTYRDSYYHRNPSRNRRGRLNRPAIVLRTAPAASQQYYALPNTWKPCPSDTTVHTGLNEKRKRQWQIHRRRMADPVSLYSILARYLRACSGPRIRDVGLQFELGPEEDRLLQSRGFSLASVEQWAACILAPSSLEAAEIFLSHRPDPPFFVVLLFLRRAHIRQRALGILMHHLNDRLQRTEISWQELEILSVRLLRHARLIWPESIPAIAELFTREAERFLPVARARGRRRRLLSNISNFCNTMLSLISLPTNLRPFISAAHQQKAQFRVLEFMASQESVDGSRSALIVTRDGFRATVRTQLAHSKTAQERDWAQLKGSNWPPWVREHTAMDEGKGYEYGASRACRVLHRMHEAGYGSSQWEKLAQVYGGWDTDFSPTIQTRTLLAVSPQSDKQKWFKGLLWAARVRTTRTRREAWACFLACEASSTPPCQDVYRAMFEKLYFPEAKVSSVQRLLAGDMREVLPEPMSPHELTHISEPIPSYKQLLTRMIKNHIHPTGRNLAFLLETSPDLSWALGILRSSEENQQEVQALLDGSILDQEKTELPGYLLSAFISCLCRHGRLLAPDTEPIRPSVGEHEIRFPQDRGYLLQYAYALLVRLRPRHGLGWTAYLRVLLYSQWTVHASIRKPVIQYRITCELLDIMRAADCDIDEEQFRIYCTAIRSVAESGLKGSLHPQLMEDIFTAGLRRLRTTFHDMVSGNAEPAAYHLENVSNELRAYIPGPAALHAYARALGALLDYEGIYSFTTWLSDNHEKITERVQAQRGGQDLLRRALVATRIAMEGLSAAAGSESAPEELIMLVRTQIEGVPEWGGWPTDEEVERYLQK